MSRLGTTLRFDMLLQQRSKLYHIGVVVAVLMGLAIRYLFSPSAMGTVLPSFVLVGIGGTTFMFCASLVLLEKSERTLEALRMSPLQTRDYLLSKAITLTGFAAIECGIVMAVAGFDVGFHPLPMLAGLLGLGLANTFFGLALVASHQSVTTFLFPNALLLVGLLQIPVFGALDLGPPVLYYLIPSQGPFVLMLGAYHTLELWQWIYGAGVTAAIVAGCYMYAQRRFRTHIRLRDGATP